MKRNGMNRVPAAGCAALAALLALGLGACERKPPEPAIKAVPPVVEPAQEPRAAEPPKPVESVQAAADRMLAARVKDALLTEPVLNAHGIDVVAKDGVVTLYGTAETRMRREMAQKIAARVEGVRSVDNKLAVVAGS